MNRSLRALAITAGLLLTFTALLHGMANGATTSVATLAATDVTSTSFTGHCAVSTDVRVQSFLVYGLKGKALKNPTPNPKVILTSSNPDVAIPISGLTPGAAYDYQCRIYNSTIGTVSAGRVTVGASTPPTTTTAPPPPVTTTAPPPPTTTTAPPPVTTTAPPPPVTTTAPPPGSALTVVDRAVSSGIWDGVGIATFGTYPYDFDVDGDLDLLVNPHNEKLGLRLMRNVGGGRFERVPFEFITRSASGTQRNDRHGCAWGDLDRNGLPDLFCTMGANSGTLTDKANELWMQTSPSQFVNKTAEYGVQDPLAPGRIPVFVDVNNDGWLDLFTTNHSPRDDGTLVENRLWISESSGTVLRSAPEYGLDLPLGGVPGNQSCAVPNDYNGDGRTDLLVCGHTALKLFRNEGGSFTDVSASMGIVTGQWRNATLSDLDRDGDLDLVGINAGGTQFRVQLMTGGKFAAATQTRTLGAARQIAVGDVDADQDPDVYIVQHGTHPDVLLLNDGGAIFADTPIPQTTTGTGQSVTAFDHDQSGTMDMVVMHGYDGPGPITLLSFE